MVARLKVVLPEQVVPAGVFRVEGDQLVEEPDDLGLGWGFRFVSPRRYEKSQWRRS